MSIDLSPVKLAASLSEARFTTKLIDGTYPDYGRVIPWDNGRVATLQAEVLAAAVGRVGTVASEQGRAVKFAFSDAGLALAVTNPRSGSAQEEIDATFEGEAIEIGFNGTYVEALLSHTAPSGEIEIALRDAGSPTIFRRPDQKDALCVLMPMRV